MAAAILSILMLAGVLLLGGGIYGLTRQGDRRRSILMIVAAVVMFGNVAISAMPGPKSATLISQKR